MRSSSRRQLREVCLRDQGGLCAYCGDPLTTKTVTLDHVVPQARGGQTTRANSVAACKFCNGIKGCKSPEEFPLRDPAVADFGPQRY